MAKEVEYAVLVTTADRRSAIAYQTCKTWSGAIRCGKAWRRKAPSDAIVWVHESTRNPWSAKSYTVTRSCTLTEV